MKLRQGFSLIELLIVIVIIAVLAGLILPGITGARHRVRGAQCRTDLTNLEAALTAFKARFGVEAPSNITLCENPADWNTNLKAKASIRQIWPQFDFSLTRDINRNGSMSEIYRLDAAECLVFFLMGTIDDGESFNGFGLNPANPFERNSGGNRLRPFIELTKNRFGDKDSDGFKELFDVFAGMDRTGHPIVYYSAYDGRGYQPAELCYGMTDFYRQSSGGKPWKPQSCQLIAPGLKGILGTGGVFDPQQPDIGLGVGRDDEWDNLTNFAVGELRR